jgi:small subunit ribosomal protein S2
LFASKIADSVVEGNQAATDKQVAEVQGAIAASEGEGQAAADESGEDISMEDVLAGGRKTPMSAESEAASDTAEARHAEV